MTEPLLLGPTTCFNLYEHLFEIPNEYHQPHWWLHIHLTWLKTAPHPLLWSERFVWQHVNQLHSYDVDVFIFCVSILQKCLTVVFLSGSCWGKHVEVRVRNVLNQWVKSVQSDLDMRRKWTQPDIASLKNKDSYWWRCLSVVLTKKPPISASIIHGELLPVSRPSGLRCQSV